MNNKLFHFDYKRIILIIFMYPIFYFSLARSNSLNYYNGTMSVLIGLMVAAFATLYTCLINVKHNTNLYIISIIILSILILISTSCIIDGGIKLMLGNNPKENLNTMVKFGTALFKAISDTNFPWIFYVHY